MSVKFSEVDSYAQFHSQQCTGVGETQKLKTFTEYIPRTIFINISGLFDSFMLGQFQEHG